MKKRNFFVLLLGLWAFGLAHCGGESLNEKMEIKLVPNNPIVINADLTLTFGSGANATEVVIDAPWFVVYPEYTNNSDENILFVVTLKFKARSNTGKTTILTMDPDSICEDDNSTRAYAAIVLPKTTYVNSEGDKCDPLVYNDDRSDRDEPWYVDALPKGSNFFYSIEVEAEGWIADKESVPIERLSYKSIFVTQ